MRTLLIFTFLSLIFLNGFSQRITYKDVQAQPKKKVKIKDIPKYIQYTSKDNIVYEVGDTVKLGLATGNNSFKSFYLYKSPLTMSNLPSTYQNNSYTIVEISSANNVVSFTLKLKMGGVLKNYSIKTFDVETAFVQGELKRNGLTSDEALEELKKWKSKLDLELINQEQYETKKAELSKYIK